VDLPRTVGNPLELVPVRPPSHEDALLAAAAFAADRGSPGPDG